MEAAVLQLLPPAHVVDSLDDQSCLLRFADKTLHVASVNDGVPDHWVPVRRHPWCTGQDVELLGLSQRTLIKADYRVYGGPFELRLGCPRLALRSTPATSPLLALQQPPSPRSLPGEPGCAAHSGGGWKPAGVARTGGAGACLAECLSGPVCCLVCLFWVVACNVAALLTARQCPCGAFRGWTSHVRILFGSTRCTGSSRRTPLLPLRMLCLTMYIIGPARERCSGLHSTSV